MNSIDMAIHPISETVPEKPLHDAPPAVRLTAGKLMCATLMMIALESGGPLAPSEVEARQRQAAPDAIATAKNPSKAVKHCLQNKQIRLTLSARETDIPGKAGYMIKATSCKKTTPKQLKNVTISETVHEPGPDYQSYAWKFKRFRAGRTMKRDILVKQPKSQYQVSNAEDNSQTIVLEAYFRRVSKGSRKIRKVPLGRNTFKLHDGMPYEVAQSDDVITPKPCHPDPDFALGIHDDNAFIYQKTASREQAFETATALFGARVLRINMIYGSVKKYGEQVYVDTVNAAAQHGYKVHISLMATPAYNPELDQKLNYENLDPATMREFARDVTETMNVSTQPGTVAAYTIHNEPNHPLFNATVSQSRYDAMFVAGREGVLSANPNVKVLPGGLAPDSEETQNSWIKNYKQVLGADITLHPYGYVMDRVPGIVENNPGTPVYLPEYGNPAADPEQALHNAQAITTARCAGVKLLTFMQLYRYPEIASWNTGVIDSPNAAK